MPAPLGPVMKAWTLIPALSEFPTACPAALMPAAELFPPSSVPRSVMPAPLGPVINAWVLPPVVSEDPVAWPVALMPLAKVSDPPRVPSSVRPLLPESTIQEDLAKAGGTKAKPALSAAARTKLRILGEQVFFMGGSLR